MRSVVSLIVIGALAWPGNAGAEPPVQQQSIDWYAVRTTRPGDELIIIARDSRPVVRYFVQADDTSITVLNLASPSLPRRAARALRDLATTSPGQFGRLRSPGFELLLADNGFRLSSEGLFAADRKLADLDQLIETMTRDRLVEVKTTYHLPRGATVAIVTAIAVTAGLVMLAAFCNGACIGR
jgi:hypothetical protein